MNRPAHKILKTTIGQVTFEFEPETEDSQIEIIRVYRTSDSTSRTSLHRRIYAEAKVDAVNKAFFDMESEGLINTHTLYAKLEQAAIDAKNDADNEYNWGPVE